MSTKWNNKLNIKTDTKIVQVYEISDGSCNIKRQSDSGRQTIQYSLHSWHMAWLYSYFLAKERLLRYRCWLKSHLSLSDTFQGSLYLRKLSNPAISFLYLPFHREWPPYVGNAMMPWLPCQATQVMHSHLPNCSHLDCSSQYMSQHLQTNKTFQVLASGTFVKQCHRYSSIRQPTQKVTCLHDSTWIAFLVSRGSSKVILQTIVRSCQVL